MRKERGTVNSAPLSRIVLGPTGALRLLVISFGRAIG